MTEPTDPPVYPPPELITDNVPITPDTVTSAPGTVTGNNELITDNVPITPGTVTSTTGTIAFGGNNELITDNVLRGGVLLLCAGAIAVVAARRRRTPDQEVHSF